MKLIPVFCGLVLALTLTACGSVVVGNRIDAAQKIAKDAQLEPFVAATKMFKIAALRRVSDPSKPLTLYIEGDGFAWRDKYTISSNPTPKNPVGLKMASLDAAANVIYLSRPCQYVDLETEENCPAKFWTSHRFSPDIIKTYLNILNGLSKQYGHKGFHLVGFSGGGAVALLIAANRTDILSVRTVAGNLDHAALNKFHDVSPLKGSLNPISYAARLKSIPQIHYSGAKDTVVPSWVSTKFAKAVNNPKCVRTVTIDGASHVDGWIPVWRQLNTHIPQC